MSENKNCGNCAYWQPNGGVLGYGYCIQNGWGYRKRTQSCKDAYSPRVEMKAKVTCRYGVEYEVFFFGTEAACNRSVALMGRCCCWVCHNKKCEHPRNEVLKDCENVCEIWTKKRHYCDLIENKELI